MNPAAQLEAYTYSAAYLYCAASIRSLSPWNIIQKKSPVSDAFDSNVNNSNAVK